MPNSLVVVPTYNEADNLPVLAAALLRLEYPGLHLLIVDDASPDGTGQIADELAARHAGCVHVLHRAAKTGLGRAYVDGYLWALERGYDAVAQMDADLSHDPADVPQLLNAAREADVVIGSRYLNGVSVINWPFRRILLSKGANEYVRRVTGMPIADATSGFRVYRADALRRIRVETIASNGYSFQVEMTYRAFLSGCKIVEESIVFTERRSGQSKMSRSVIVESALMPWRLRLGRARLARILRQPPPPPSAREGSAGGMPGM